MKRLDFEKFLSILSTDLYSFAYVLIPDDLQAGQLIVDSIQTYLLSKKNNLELLFQIKNKNISNELIPIKRDLLNLVYELAKKRYQHIKLSFDENNSHDFFSLEMDEKATLYLREKAKLSIDDIAVITLKTKSEVLAYLYGARLKMIDTLPYEIRSEVQV